MLSYPARIARDGARFMVSFVDIPEALSDGGTREEAMAMAADALTTAMDFYFEDKRAVPKPSAPKRGQTMIDLPASVSAKVLLLNEMLQQHMKPAELARRMSVRRQEVNRLTDLHHPTKIDTISQALLAIGMRLVLRLV